MLYTSGPTTMSRFQRVKKDDMRVNGNIVSAVTGVVGGGDESVVDGGGVDVVVEMTTVAASKKMSLSTVKKSSRTRRRGKRQPTWNPHRSN